MLMDLPDGHRGLTAQRGEKAVVFISRALSPVERLVVLAHELAHLERGGSGWVPGMPDRLMAIVGREESRVDRIVAERLVPSEALARWVERRSEVEPITAELVAQEWDVTPEVAELALSLLRAA